MVPPVPRPALGVQLDNQTGRTPTERVRGRKAARWSHALLGLGWLLTAPSARAAARDEGRWSWSLRPSIEAEYSSNPLRLTRRRLAQVGAEAVPGDRLYGIDGPGDWGVEPAVAIRLGAKMGRKSHLRLQLEVAHCRWTRNRQASYSEIALGLEYRLRRLGLELGSSLTPRRYRRNYRPDGIGGQLPFSAAHYFEVEPRVSAAWRWTKHLSSRATYELGLRRYEQLHTNLDRNRHEISLASGYQGRRGDLLFELAAAAASTPARIEGVGFVIDRSYREGTATLKARFRGQLGVDATASVAYRVRQFLTLESRDVGRHERVDRRPEVRLALRKRWKSGLSLTARSNWMLNQPNRRDAGTAAEDFAYEVFGFGAGLEYRL